MTQDQQQPFLKENYRKPEVDFVPFSGADILTLSGGGDEDQGEWDPQVVNDAIDDFVRK